MTFNQEMRKVTYKEKFRLILYWTKINPKLTRTALRVFVELVHRRNWQTGRCDPSQDFLASSLDISRTSVTNAIGELKQRGAIYVWSGGKGVSNKYVIKFTVLDLAEERVVEGDNWGCQDGQPRLSKLVKQSGTKQEKEHKNNNEHSRSTYRTQKPRSSGHAVIVISPTEVGPIAAWRTWLFENADQEPSVVLEATKKDGNYLLPCRYPEVSSDKTSAYLAYFSSLIERQTTSSP